VPEKNSKELPKQLKSQAVVKNYARVPGKVPRKLRKSGKLPGDRPRESVAGATKSEKKHGSD
jgi:hypothetical protein